MFVSAHSLHSCAFDSTVASSCHVSHSCRVQHRHGTQDNQKYTADGDQLRANAKAQGHAS
eukprot:364247-Chlamydomonas_euryale.AAC.23